MKIGKLFFIFSIAFMVRVVRMILLLVFLMIWVRDVWMCLKSVVAVLKWE